MNIKNLNKAEVLIALYNRAQCIGLGKISHNPNYVMTIEEAEKLLKQSTHFDYHNGKAMKIYLDSDELNTDAYNENNGKNAAEKVLQPLIDKYKEKCTPKTLKAICVPIVIKNKNTLFSRLRHIPADLCDEFPLLEVDPMKVFKRKVKRLLDEAKLTDGSKEMIYAQKLYKALDTPHPYNGIHPLIKEIKAQCNKAYFSTFAGKMEPIITNIIKYMNEYRIEKDEYNNKVNESIRNKTITKTI